MRHPDTDSERSEEEVEGSFALLRMTFGRIASAYRLRNDTITGLNNKGQVGIIMLLVLAFALIFYAASMNIGHLSQTKTITQVAAMAGASQLASQMSSYGQKLFQEQLGGKKRICALTGVFMAILTIIIVIILIVITIMTMGGAAPAWGVLPGLVSLAVALVLSIANLILQAAVIQPGLTAMWNKVIQDTMSIQDQFIEQGIQSGLQIAVTDNKFVPDMQDFDTDYVWGFDSAKKPKDLINRYAIYYSKKRLTDIYTPSLARLARFMNELRDFVYQTANSPYDDPPVNRSPNWGLYDPPDCIDHPEQECCYDASIDPDGDGIPGKPIPSTCNPCCIPEKVPNPFENPDVVGDEFIPLRPSCCDCIQTGCPAASQCGTALTCAALSPYGADYPYVYTRYYENRENNFPRKRIQVAPVEDPNIITIDGKMEMPFPSANMFRNVFFEDSFCPGSEPPTGQIRNEYQGLIYSFGKSGCPKDFIPVRETVTPTPPDPFGELYPGYCTLVTPKVSKVGYYDFAWGCDGIEPPPDAFISFREALGTDDENKNFRKDPEFDFIRGANGRQVPDPDNKFRLEDTTGYYNVADYPGLSIADKKKGIFPFFYKLKDWGTDLSTIDLTTHPEHCYWYDKRTRPCAETGPVINQQPGGLRPQLELPLDPATTPGLVVNTTDHVDFVNVGGAILRPDAVDVPSTNNTLHSSTGIIGLDDECAQHISPLYPGEPPSKGFWKPGGDRFCQPPENPPPIPDGQNWPYFGHCAKSGGITEQCKLPSSFTDTDGDGDVDDDDREEDTYQECYCGHPDRPGDPSDFPDDVLDDLVYGMTDFLDETRALFRKWESRRTRLAVNFKFWYPNIAEWIEPKEGNGTCFICDPDVQGQLWDARDAVKELISRVESWRDVPYSDNNVWCMPVSDPKVMWDEQASFGSGGVQDVINCLTHNLSNYTRFKACYDASVSAQNMTVDPPPYDWGDPITRPGVSAEGYNQILAGRICNPLPRSLVSGFNGNNWIDSNPYRLQELLDCQPKTCVEKFRTCNDQRCQVENACEGQFLYDDWACDNGNLNCQTQCLNCSSGCSWNMETPIPDYLDDDNSDFQACTNPRIEEGNCATNKGSCYEKYICCLSPCPPAPNACSTNCDNQFNACNITCNFNYADYSNPTSCVNSCLAVPVPVCKADAEAKRVKCWVDAKNKPVTGWDACRTNNTTCGGNSGTAYDCRNDIHFVISDSWTGNGLYDVNGSPTLGNYCHWPTPPPDLPPGIHPPGWPPPDPPPPEVNPADLDTGTPIPAFLDDIEANRGSSRDDPINDNELIDMVRKSIPEAENQVAKFKVRRDFLASRLAEANEILAILRETEKEITEFLEGAFIPISSFSAIVPNGDTILNALISNGILEYVSGTEVRLMVNVNENRDLIQQIAGADFNQVWDILQTAQSPAKDLIEYRKEFEDLPSGLPYHAIYGWQGPPAEKREEANRGLGYWHIVKVEGRTPYKCDNRCGIDKSDPDRIVKDPQWPRVKTYTKNWGLERCYELVNTDGIVKFRVTRFDEDWDKRTTKFSTGQKIWDYRFFNPLRGRGYVGNLGDTCFEASLSDPSGLPAGVKDIYKGAFLMNRPENDPDCWTKANELLSKGASTELCAQYYYHGGDHKGMSHNFIKCRKDW